MTEGSYKEIVFSWGEVRELMEDAAFTAAMDYCFIEDGKIRYEYGQMRLRIKEMLEEHHTKGRW